MACPMTLVSSILNPPPRCPLVLAVRLSIEATASVRLEAPRWFGGKGLPLKAMDMTDTAVDDSKTLVRRAG